MVEIIKFYVPRYYNGRTDFIKKCVFRALSDDIEIEVRGFIEHQLTVVVTGSESTKLYLDLKHQCLLTAITEEISHG